MEDEQTMMEMPEGEMPDVGNSTDGSRMNNAFGNMFSLSDSTVTLTITDVSLLEECTMDDIIKDSFITITFGDNNTITSITVIKLTNNPNGGTAPEQPKNDSESES